MCLLGAPLGFSIGQVTLDRDRMDSTAFTVRGLEGRPWGRKGQGKGWGRGLYDTASFLHGGWQAGFSCLPKAEVKTAVRLSLPPKDDVS